jgi:hypothetical protein
MDTTHDHHSAKARASFSRERLAEGRRFAISPKAAATLFDFPTMGENNL